MKLLDLFCGAGGASTGYARAGFEVVGVDKKPQPRYPFTFIQDDVLEVLEDKDFLDSFDAIHASPPCQTHSALSNLGHVKAKVDAGIHVDLIPQTREALTAFGKPWVIENVPGAPLIDPMLLCGTEFDLCVDTEAKGRVWLKRHRLFESNVPLTRKGECSCSSKRGKTIGVYGSGDGGGKRGWKGTIDNRRTAMGIGWMNRAELAQAIPPAYTFHIGKQLAIASSAKVL